MGVDDRRERERARRRREILDAAWAVADEVGWGSFSVEKVAAKAELGRATVYGYFDSLDALMEELAKEALDDLSARLSTAPALADALDVPLRFSQTRPAAFALLYHHVVDATPVFAAPAVERMRREAGEFAETLLRLASRTSASLPADSASAHAFLSSIAVAGAIVPELRSNTPLRRKWQEFCLSLGVAADPRAPGGPGHRASSRRPRRAASR